MSIRTKTLLITGFAIIALIVTVSLITAKIVLDGVNTLEVQRVQTNIERVNDAINNQLDYLRGKSSDWAYWDDTYNYVYDHNAAYVAANLMPETFGHLNVESMLFIDDKGRVAYARTYNYKTQVDATASADLIEATQQINERLQKAPLGTDVTGFLLLSEGPMYISARQILHSDNTGPIHGVLLFSELVDPGEIGRLAKITDTHLAVHRLDGPIAPGDQQMIQELLQGKKLPLSILSGNQIAGYILQKDVNNKNVLLFDVVQNRDYYQEGVSTMKILLIGFGISGVVFLLIVLITLEWLVLSPLVHLRVNVDHVTESADPHERIPDSGSKDELGALTRDLNKMLQSLEQSQQQVKSEQAKSQAYINIVGVMVVVISTDQKIVLMNKQACDVLEVSPGEVIGKNWFDTFVPEENREQVKAVFDQVIQGKTEAISAYENEVVTKSGKRRLIAWRNTIIRNESGAIVASLSSGEDITDTKMSQEKIISRAHELEELNKMMVGRELKMAELKKEIDELRAKLGQS